MKSNKFFGAFFAASASVAAASIVGAAPGFAEDSNLKAIDRVGKELVGRNDGNMKIVDLNCASCANENNEFYGVKFERGPGKVDHLVIQGAMNGDAITYEGIYQDRYMNSEGQLNVTYKGKFFKLDYLMYVTSSPDFRFGEVVIDESFAPPLHRY